MALSPDPAVALGPFDRRHGHKRGKGFAGNQRLRVFVLYPSTQRHCASGAAVDFNSRRLFCLGCRTCMAKANLPSLPPASMTM